MLKLFIAVFIQSANQPFAHFIFICVLDIISTDEAKALLSC